MARMIFSGVLAVVLGTIAFAYVARLAPRLVTPPDTLKAIF